MKLPIELIQSFTIPQLIDYVMFLHPELGNEDIFPSMSSFWNYICHSDTEDVDKAFYIHLAMNISDRTCCFTDIHDLIEFLVSCDWSQEFFEALTEHLDYVFYRVDLDLFSLAHSVDSCFGVKVPISDVESRRCCIRAFLGIGNGLEQIWIESERLWAFELGKRLTRNSIEKSKMKFQESIKYIMENREEDEKCYYRSLYYIRHDGM